jgi:hypothetical protein
MKDVEKGVWTYREEPESEPLPVLQEDKLRHKAADKISLFDIALIGPFPGLKLVGSF